MVELMLKPQKIHISSWDIHLERSGTPSLKFGTDLCHIFRYWSVNLVETYKKAPQASFKKM